MTCAAFAAPKVDVMAAAFAQTLGANRCDKTAHRAVIQHDRRRNGRKLELHVEGVALTGANLLAVRTESEALFVVFGDHLLELGQSHRLAMGVERRQQRLDGDPAICIECDADPLRLVAQDQAQKFTE